MNATTVQGELASIPSGDEYLIYGHNALNFTNHDPARLLKDDNGLPLRSSVFAL